MYVRACARARVCVCYACIHAFIYFLSMCVPLSSAIFTFSEFEAWHRLDRR